MNLYNDEIVQSGITDIKVPGIATMGFWSIFRTQEAIYFVKTGSALGLGIGTNNLLLTASLVSDAIESYMSEKQIEKGRIGAILYGAKEYTRFTTEQFHLIKTKKRLFGGKVIFPNGKEKSWKEAGFVKFKLSPKKFKACLNMLNR